MLRGMQTSATGMEAQKLNNEVIADNLANASTSGYKAYSLVHKTHSEKNITNLENGIQVGKITYGSEVYDTAFDMSQGALRQTGNPLDIAISGEGFFPVQDLEGNVSYTRNGHFNLDSTGFLVTQSGEYVLDSGLSPVYIGLEGITSVTVLRTGNVMVNGSFNSTIQPLAFPKDASIIRKGHDKFIKGSVNVVMQKPANVNLQQGFIETSNVSSVKAAADMVQIMRTYEANQQALKVQADTLGMLMNIADGI